MWGKVGLPAEDERWRVCNDAVARMREVKHVVDSIRISAFTEPEAREVAEIVDEALNADARSRTLSFPEVQWAREELERMKKGETSKLSGIVCNTQCDSFEKKLERVEKAYTTGEGLLGLVRAPPLRLAGTVYENVFALPKNQQLGPMLELAGKSGFDLIVVEDADANRYLAVNGGGRLNRVEKNAEAILAGKDWQHVRVIHVDDVVNSFFEGTMALPRGLGERVEDYFESRIDSSINQKLKAGVDDAIDRVNNPEMKETDKPSRSPALVVAGAVSVGGAALSTFIGVAPEVLASLAGIAAVTTVYNAMRGALRRPDPHFVLNVMGVHLAGERRIPISKLD